MQHQSPQECTWREADRPSHHGTLSFLIANRALSGFLLFLVNNTTHDFPFFLFYVFLLELAFLSQQ